MRISNRCYAVTGLAYSTPWCVNAGFIAGEETTLVVDTGGNTLAAQTIHGYATAVRPTNRIAAINTEKHFDHLAGNSFFRQHAIDVWGHPACARTPAEFAAEIAEMNAAIPNPARRARAEAAAFFHATALAGPNRRVENGSRFEPGDCAAEILFTPGHTASNISLWIPSEGVLYCGDCLIQNYLPNLDAGTSADWQTWLASIEQIEALAPDAIVPGHGPVARGPAGVAAIIASVRGVLEKAIAIGRSPTA